MTDCRRCTRPSADQAVLCHTCTATLRAALTTTAGMLGMLRLNAAGQARTAGPIGRISGTGHGDGVSVHALDVLAEVRGVVAGWLRIMLEEGIVTGLPERLDNGFADTAALCLHLADHAHVLRHHELAPDVASDVLDTDVPSICLALEGSSRRPPLTALVRQVVDTHRARDESFAAAAGDRLAEAFDRTVPVALAVRAVREQGVSVTERQARRWVSEQRLLVEHKRRSMESEPEVCVMPSSLVELAAQVKRGRRPA